MYLSTSPRKTSTQPLWPVFLEKCFGTENADGSELILAGDNPQKFKGLYWVVTANLEHLIVYIFPEGFTLQLVGTALLAILPPSHLIPLDGCHLLQF